MCAIVGGTRRTEKEFKLLEVTRTRGRDYSNVFIRNQSWICNHRAIPTTETSNPEHNQPFGTDYKIVHNGTIANDVELGKAIGEIDSSVLFKVLDCTNIDTLHQTIQKVKGSYAIAIMKPNGTFYLACNYKPIAYSYERDENGLKKLVAFASYIDDLKYCEYSNIERLPPYSILDTETWEVRNIPRTDYHNALVICSGGLDSTAVAAYACYIHKPENVTLIHYRYGCIAETKEIQCVKKIAEYLKCNLDFIDVNMSFMNKNSALFRTEDDIHKGIEGSEYAYEWVPARNLIMLSLAVGYAEANRITNIYLGTNLEEGGCLSGDTIVKIRKDANYREVTLEELYSEWNSEKENFFNSGVPTIRTMLSNGVLTYVPIDNVYYSGEKNLIKITLEDGSYIKSSTEHEFFTSKGYVQSNKLTIGDEIWCNGTRYRDMTDEQYTEWKRKLSIAKRGDRNPNKNRENADRIRISCNLKFASERITDEGYIYVGGMGFHPYCTSTNHVYKHRLVVEASMNNMTYDDWVLKLRSNNLNGSEQYLDPDLEVHHIDQNKSNNNIENLEVLTAKDHSLKHSEEDEYRGCMRIKDIAKLKKIIKIESIGTEKTYDISVRGTHCYIANGFIGHNSYPDNENQFIRDFDSCLYGAVQNGVKVKVHTPVGNLMKHEIVAFGNKYGAPFQYTWSCYKKGDKPCGQCGPCFMRRTAFRRNGLEDPLEYPRDMIFDEVEDIKKNIVSKEV